MTTHLLIHSICSLCHKISPKKLLSIVSKSIGRAPLFSEHRKASSEPLPNIKPEMGLKCKASRAAMLFLSSNYCEISLLQCV